MSCRATLSVSLLFALIAASGCDDGGASSGPGDAGNTDSDSDSDTDVDSDSDTDTDTDDTDTSTLPLTWPPYDSSPSATTSDPGYATGAGFADIDGDGRLDLVIADGNDMDPGPLRVYLAEEDGSLPTTASWSGSEDAYHGHLALGDVDGDGFTDVVVSVFLGPGGFSDPGGVAYYRNLDGELAPTPTWTSADAFYTFSVALGDVDNDGDLDLAVGTGEAYYHGPEPDRLYVNDGGAFEEPATWIADDLSFSFDPVFADFDDDGWLDLAFARSGGPHAIYFNDCAGQLETSPSWEASGGVFEGNTADFGDLDGDGWLDLVVSNNNQLYGTGLVDAFCGPDLELCWTSEDPPAMQSAVALADLDGDLDLDLAAGAWWGALRFYRNETEEPGELVLETTPSHTSATATVVEAIVFADLDQGETWEEVVEGEGPLLELPRRCVVVEASTDGAVGDGY
ncbi:MAG: VCBS repeat-containing protein, partial [Deltaproteobacteria bacterium]|nr:VCBS repeat-containing protein [Deltaproteobacteria bacterium]